MKKIISILAALAMMFALCTGAMAANTLDGQAKNADATVLYYDRAGQLTDGTGFPTSGNAVVRVSKTIESAGTENEFNVTLDVKTTQDIRVISSSKADAATMLIIDASSSMEYCMQHGWGCQDDSHQTRFEVAKNNAITLLNTFSALDQAHGGHRYMAIVAYDGSAYTVMDWLDVANEANRATAEEYIDEMKSGSGTNIEAGLMLGANVWDHAAVNDIAYKYTVLLTDGQPTRYVPGEDTTSRDRINGSTWTQTNENAVADVGREAARILSKSRLAKLYSVCIGNVANETHFQNWPNANPPTTKDMTVLEWLRKFSNNASSALNAAEMLSSFQSIISQIQLAAQAWKVDDVMGPHAVFVGQVGPQGIYNKYEEKNGLLHWDVLGSNVQKVTQIGENSVQLDYSLVYKVKLDNLDTQYKAESWTPANTEAKLTYAVLNNSTGLWQQVNPVAFPVPQMKGYKGNLEFTKVYLDDGEQKPIEGMTFELRSNDQSAENVMWVARATSGANGKVTFTDIPSGHSYTLAEVNAYDKGFADPSDRTLTVTLGEVKDNLQGGTLVNTKRNRNVSLEISKKFEGLPDNVRPQSILIEAKHGEHTHTALLHADNNWTATLGGLEPNEEYTITEKGAEIDGYKMSVTAKIDGQTMSVNGAAVKKVLTLDADHSHQTYEVEFTNTYARKEGSAKISKRFMERTGVDANNKPVLEVLKPELYADASVTVALVNEKNETVKTVTLSGSNDWAADLGKLPEGVYTIHETQPADIANHEFVHVHLLDKNGNEIEGNQVTITDGANIELTLENHYMHLVGQIVVVKDFALQGGKQGETVAVPENQKFEVDVYAQWTGNSGAYVPQGDPVTTIEVYKRESGDWMGTSAAITVGQYLLVEKASTAIHGYTFKEAAFNTQLVTVTHGTAPVHARLTNTYEKDKGSLTISKTFDFSDLEEGDAAKADELDLNITFLIQQLNDDNVYETVDSVLLNKTVGWEKMVELPVGTYRLVERGADAQANTGYTFDGLNVSVNGGAVQPLTATEAGTSGFMVTIPTAQDANVSYPTVTISVTNKYTRDTGSLTIRKAFGTDADTAEAMKTLEAIDVLLYKDGEPVKKVTLRADTTPAWQVTIPALETGNYMLVEVHSQGVIDPKTNQPFNSAYVEGYTLIHQWDSAAVMLDKGQEITHTVTNTYAKKTGMLFVSKRFDGLPQDKWPSVTIEAKQGDTTVGSIVLGGNTWRGTMTLPIGEYTLEETAEDVGGYMHTETRFQVGPGEVTTGSANVTVTEGMNPNAYVYLTNSYTQLTGGIAVSKQVISSYDSDKDKAFEFTMTLGQKISGTFGDMTFENGVATFTLKHGETKVATGLPAGMAWTVKETEQAGFTTQIGDEPGNGASGTIGEDAEISVPFVNTRVSDQQLTIGKKVDSALRSDYEKVFTFKVKLSDSSAAGSFHAKLTNGVSTTGKIVTFAAGEATIQLKHGEAMTIDGLPVGMGFRVSEQESSEFLSTATESNDIVMDGVIGEDMTATFVNVRKSAAADLIVSKKVAGSAASQEDVFTFEVRVENLVDGTYGDMTFVGGVATVQLKHGQKAVATGLPAGVAYTVTETDCGAYTPDVTQYKGTLGASGFEAAFVNTLEAPKLPETGDESKIMLWSALLMMAGAALLMLKRRNA